MRIVFVCFGAVTVLFSGMSLLHHQEAIKSASSAEIAKLDRVVKGLKCCNFEFSNNSPAMEPRILLK